MSPSTSTNVKHRQMQLQNLPTEVLFQVCWHLDYSDLLAMLEIPVLAAQLKRFIRLVTDNDDFGIETMKPFYQLEQHAWDEPFPDYSINIVLIWMEYFQEVRKAGDTLKHTKSFIGTLREGIDFNKYEMKNASARDGVYDSVDIYDFNGHYEPYLIRNSVIVTNEEGVTLDGDVEVGSITGPNLHTIRFAQSETVHPGFFYGLPVSTIMVYNCHQNVLNEVIAHCLREPKVKKLDLVGVGRSAGDQGYYHWDDYANSWDAASTISSLTFENLTTLKLMMMHSIKDLVLPQVKTLVISTTPDKVEADECIDPLVSNIKAPLLEKLDFAFFQMVPRVNRLAMPNCQSLEVTFYLDAMDDRDGKWFYMDTVASDTYGRHLNLPTTSSNIVVNNCFQFLNPNIFANATDVTIRQNVLVQYGHTTLFRIVPAYQLKNLSITGPTQGDSIDSYHGLPAFFDSPNLTKLFLNCCSDYSYMFPTYIMKFHPNLESLSIISQNSFNGTPIEVGAPESFDFQIVKLINLKELTLKGFSKSNARKWLNSITPNTLETFTFANSPFIFGEKETTKSLFKALSNHKESLLSISAIDLGISGLGLSARDILSTEHLWLEGYPKLYTLHVSGLTEYLIKNCPLMEYLRVNPGIYHIANEPTFITLKDVPKLKDLIFSSMKYKAENGEIVQVLEGDTTDPMKNIKAISGVPDNVKIKNMYVGSAAQLNQIKLEKERLRKLSQPPPPQSQPHRPQQQSQGVPFELEHGEHGRPLDPLAQIALLRAFYGAAFLGGQDDDDDDDDDGEDDEDGGFGFDEDGIPNMAFDDDDEEELAHDFIFNRERFFERMAFREFMEDNDQYW